MPVLLTPSEYEKLHVAIQEVDKQRKRKVKTCMELELSMCTAKVYHMASPMSDNPTVRIDLKMKG